MVAVQEIVEPWCVSGVRGCACVPRLFEIEHSGGPEDVDEVRH